MPKRATALSRTHDAVSWLVCTLPLWSLVLFYSFTLRARLALGSWPLPYQPDPKALGFDLHHGAVWLSFVLPLAAAPGVAVLLALHRGRGAAVRRWAGLILYLSLLVGWWWLMRSDPGSLAAWFVD